MTKFADRQTKNKQAHVSKTESTLILSGSSLDTRGSWPIIFSVQIMECTDSAGGQMRVGPPGGQPTDWDPPE